MDTIGGIARRLVLIKKLAEKLGDSPAVEANLADFIRDLANFEMTPQEVLDKLGLEWDDLK